LSFIKKPALLLCSAVDDDDDEEEEEEEDQNLNMYVWFQSAEGAGEGLKEEMKGA
jgi:hypothetical protein